MPTRQDKGASEIKPTHYCVACAARWIEWPDGNWSVTTDCGPCCDNVAMDVAPIIAIQPDGSINSADYRRVRGAWDSAKRQEQIDRYGGILCAICDAPFEHHYADWGCPVHVAPRFKFPASGTPTRRAETTGSVGEADGGPTANEESGDAQTQPGTDHAD